MAATPKSVQHFKDALKEVSSEPGSTVHYSAGGQADPQINPDDVGTINRNLEGRDLYTAPRPDGRGIDVIERVDLPPPTELASGAADTSAGGTGSMDREA